MYLQLLSYLIVLESAPGINRNTKQLGALISDQV